MSKDKKRRQLERFYNEDPCCRWCKKPTLLLTLKEKQQWEPGKPYPLNMATTDHVYSRFSPLRHEPADNKLRHVLACYACNQQRSKEEMKGFYKELHAKKSHKSCKINQLVLQFPSGDEYEYGNPVQASNRTGIS